MKEEKDLKGSKFGKLLVLGRGEDYTYSGGRKKSRWVCLCECGNKKTILQHLLVTGKRNSCGCDKFPKTRLKYGESSSKRLYKIYERVAGKRNIPFLLTLEEFLVITKENCYYCGEPPSQSILGDGNYGAYVYNGIDRKNNRQGYVSENVVPCCKACNKMKSDIELDSFFDRILKIYKNWYKDSKEEKAAEELENA